MILCTRKHIYNQPPFVNVSFFLFLVSWKRVTLLLPRLRNLALNFTKR